MNKTPSLLPAHQPLQNRRTSVHQRRAPRLLHGMAAFAGSSLLAVGSLRAANAEFDVASESTTQQTTTTTVNLNTASTYTGGVVPGTTVT